MDSLSCFLGGLLLGCLLTLSLAFPAVGRAVAKILAVILLGLGVGFLVWASVSVRRGDQLRPPFGSNIITEVSEAYGWGGGLLLGGVISLVLALSRWRAGKDQDGRADPVVVPNPVRR